MFSLKDMLSRFTDAFNKNPYSNIGKLIGILHGQMNDLDSALVKVRDWRSIDIAQGTTLDRIGQNVIQPRGAATDEVYRVLLKSKIARNLSKTDINTIIRVLALALNCDFADIRIQEKFSAVIDPEPAALSLIRVPIKRLNEVGMSPRQFAQIIQKTVAAGVKVAQIELAGTFRLSPVYEQLRNDSVGLGNIEMTLGGTLGEVYVAGDDYGLPI
ncbi:hypothetical protein [Paenibacillus macquariensis]|uniref:DUF2612 domain-containing protein n=1 Tax=Paenibacillus macquariensis TaxID=948756 RepID=A0ABY1JSB4_9BACL|nr:hypothetical protein [Paenibacillus macquariensis]MEC0092895.1 hypothetical protein [Paenibacillus macquariensis]OAB36266.1 hypothetical protein PMSM_07410 [Paenibacillus macquariensis subsp. macquariensis]SIQ68306.1 hypothetical protein SAMN05421578_103349 [Paenibacillus macquariensis]